MKKYFLTINKYHGCGSPRSGERTHFREKILSKEKIHIIRADYRMWKKRIDEVNAGEAILLLQYYRPGRMDCSDRNVIVVFDKDSGLGVQELFFRHGNVLYPTISTEDAQVAIALDVNTISRNEGISHKEFISSFNRVSLLEYNQPKSMAVIHISKFRY